MVWYRQVHFMDSQLLQLTPWTVSQDPGQRTWLMYSTVARELAVNQLCLDLLQNFSSISYIKMMSFVKTCLFISRFITQYQYAWNNPEFPQPPWLMVHLPRSGSCSLLLWLPDLRHIYCSMAVLHVSSQVKDQFSLIENERGGLRVYCYVTWKSFIWLRVQQAKPSNPNLKNPYEIFKLDEVVISVRTTW